MHAKFKGSEFILIKDAAHIASIEQEVVFNQVMMAFLGKHTRTAALSAANVTLKKLGHTPMARKVLHGFESRRISPVCDSA